MEHVGDVGLVESCFGPLETVLVSVQDSCTVCAKHTISSEIILDAPDGTTRASKHT
jgi:rRNA processing protein Gar1